MIHDEWTRNVLKQRPDLKAEDLERRRPLMNTQPQSMKALFRKQGKAHRDLAANWVQMGVLLGFVADRQSPHLPPVAQIAMNCATSVAATGADR